MLDNLLLCILPILNLEPSQFNSKLSCANHSQMSFIDASYISIDMFPFNLDRKLASLLTMCYISQRHLALFLVFA